MLLCPAWFTPPHQRVLAAQNALAGGLVNPLIIRISQQGDGQQARHICIVVVRLQCKHTAAKAVLRQAKRPCAVSCARQATCPCTILPTKLLPRPSTSNAYVRIPSTWTMPYFSMPAAGYGQQWVAEPKAGNCVHTAPLVASLLRTLANALSQRCRTLLKAVAAPNVAIQLQCPLQSSISIPADME